MKIIYRKKDSAAFKVSDKGAKKLLEGKDFVEGPTQRPYPACITLTEEAEAKLLGGKSEKQKSKAS